MVRPTRFERVTAGTANQYSIQLSYERTPSLLRGRNYSSLILEEAKIRGFFLNALKSGLKRHMVKNNERQKDDAQVPVDRKKCSIDLGEIFTYQVVFI